MPPQAAVASIVDRGLDGAPQVLSHAQAERIREENAICLAPSPFRAPVRWPDDRLLGVWGVLREPTPQGSCLADARAPSSTRELRPRDQHPPRVPSVPPRDPPSWRES